MRWAGVKLIAITVETGFIISAYLILSTYSTAGFCTRIEALFG